jgi:hypothetical protein
VTQSVITAGPDSSDGRTDAMDSPMNFHVAAPKIPPRILCIGMPVRDLTFRIQELPGRGLKVNASHFDEIAGGNALNAAIGIVRLGGRASICGPTAVRNFVPICAPRRASAAFRSWSMSTARCRCARAC